MWFSVRYKLLIENQYCINLHIEYNLRKEWDEQVISVEMTIYRIILVVYVLI